MSRAGFDRVYPASWQYRKKVRNDVRSPFVLVASSIGGLTGEMFARR